MALKAWYPFNNNTHNYGVGDLEPTNSSPTYGDGKVTLKSLSSGSVSWSATQTASVLNNKAVSICFWIYVSAATGSTEGILFGNSSMGANNNRKFSIFQYPKCNDLHVSAMNDAASTTWCAPILSGVLPSNAWTHVAVVYNNPVLKIYINGVVKYTQTNAISNSSSFNYDTSVIRSSSGRRINDFRVYDNALSAREVAEIAKGLMVHFPMNQFYDKPNCNLITGALDYTKWGWCMATASATTSTYTEDGDYCILITRDSTASTSWSYLWCNSIDKTKIKASTKYVLSMYVKPSLDMTMWISVRDGNATNLILTLDGTQTLQANVWNKVVLVGTSVSSPTVSNQVFYISPSRSDTDMTIAFKNVSLREGTAYNQFTTSYDSNSDNTEYDCSGYLNNGSFSGTKPNAVFASPKYGSCYDFNGAGYLTFNLPFASKASVTELSISFWAYPIDSTGYSTVIFGSTGGVWISINCEGSGVWTFFGRSSDQYFRSTTKSLTLNTWHHIVVTFKDGRHRCYIDGNLDKEETKTSDAGQSIVMTKIDIAVGNITNGWNGVFNGKMSDLRFYSTELTQDAVTSLYKTRQSITKNGTLLVSGDIIEG